MGSSDPFEQVMVPDIDTSVAHTARVWNYWLGGKDYYDADREVGDQIHAQMPEIVDIARAVRGFLFRAVRHLVSEAGIRQFLDIGTGLPTANNTHEVAQATAPECRIVYVDNDPLILAHARALLTSTPQGLTNYIHADLREPDTIRAAAAHILDFTQPTALMLLGVVEHILDNDEAYAIVGRLLDALPAGSYLMMSDPTTDIGGEVMAEAIRLWNETATPAIIPRSRQEFARFFNDLEMLEPGIVSPSLWRPESNDVGVTPVEVFQLCGVGRKP
ncbi:MAG: SAM-dependent methyltransferase [Pseudonocardiaceae bacterium]